jgi:leucyl aminopeptidase
MKLTTTTKPINKVAKKYCRLEITGKPTSHHRLIEAADGTLTYQMGAGKWEEMTPRKFRIFVRSIVQAAKSHHIEHLAVQLSPSQFPQLEEYGEEWVLRTVAENVTLANYEFTKYKSKSGKKDQTELKEICLCGGMSKVAQAGFTAGQVVATAANTTRDIANTSGGDMSPRQLAAAAKAAMKGTTVKTKVLGEAELKKLKANLLLAVGQGTKEPTQMIVMEYHGASKKDAQPLVLVGKGITYDTGGLNVKPSGAMHDMHLDMSGGAAVIGAMQAIAKLKLKLNVVGIVAAAENSVSAEAMRAGDIFTAMNGKTVEVLHTDAEGRLALADALTYSERFKPKAIIDVATLTGAALVALGQQASAIMTTDEELQRLLTDLGEESGDYVWPLPLWEEYQKPLKSTRADLANIATNFSRFGGTIEGGAFLQNFAPKNVPWAHIDMAPRMESIGSDKLAKGATGEPVRLLVTLAESLQ